jgi:ribonuclease P protein component
MRYTLPKAERICKNDEFRLLFTQGKTIVQYPLKAYYLFIENNVPIVKVAFAVPKNKIKKATCRNYIKRIMREGYRKNKYIILEHLKQQTLLVTFVFISDQPVDYHKMEQNLCLILQEIKQRYLSPANHG